METSAARLATEKRRQLKRASEMFRKAILLCTRVGLSLTVRAGLLACGRQEQGSCPAHLPILLKRTVVCTGRCFAYSCAAARDSHPLPKRLSTKSNIWIRGTRPNTRTD